MNVDVAVIARSAGEFGVRENLAVNVAAALISAAAAFAMSANVTFVESFTSSHLMVVFVGLIGLHVLTRPRLLFCREFALYAALVAYFGLSTLWSPGDRALADNTISPSVNVLLIMLLFGSLVAFHDVGAVLAGSLAGCVAGAATYAFVTGFPFVYPPDFSYNAVASMHLFGLFVALAFGWATRSKLVTTALALAFLAHIAATTSIKTNLGIALGTGVAGLVYFRQSLVMVRRNVLILLLATCGGAYLVVSNDAVLERVTAGFDRVSLGLQVLSAREDLPGYSGFGEREYWVQQGLQGWASNPLFGYGVEAFRAVYGITSHSTPIDLLFNTGLIGFSLFYGMFVASAWRLLRTVGAGSRGLCALVLAVLVCNMFMTLSGTLFYQSFLGGFVGVSAALLRRLQANGKRSEPLDAI
jgi:O-antigen ligase